ncbi:MAG: DMT family transporter [Candidatus Diapherotrites archaeon]
MLWLYLVILATVIWAAVNIVDKYVVSNRIKPINYMLISGIVSFSVAVLLQIYLNLNFPDFEIILIALILAVLNVSGTLLYLKALQKEEVSKAMLVFQINPIFVLILAYLFLSEILTLQQYIGFFVVFAGVFLISFRKTISSLFEKELILMIIASLVFAIYDVIIKFTLSFTDFITLFVWLKMFYFLIILIILLPQMKETLSMFKQNKKIIPVSFIAESASASAYLIFFFALALGSVTLISLIYSVQPAFVFLFALIISIFRPDILKEELEKKHLLRKLISLVLIFAGAILLI